MDLDGLSRPALAFGAVLVSLLVWPLAFARTATGGILTQGEQTPAAPTAEDGGPDAAVSTPGAPASPVADYLAPDPRALAAALVAQLPPTRVPDAALPAARGWNQGIGALGVVPLAFGAEFAATREGVAAGSESAVVSGDGGTPGATPLATGDTAAWWLVYSQGYRRWDRRDLEGEAAGGVAGDTVPARQDHFVALFRRSGETWTEAGRVTLPCPDRLDAINQVMVAPGRLWLLVRGQADLHGRCFDLLSFDGRTLRHDLAHATDGRDTSHLEDVDGDGTAEVVLDTSDDYVLCYACGVRFIAFELRRWDGARFVPVPLAAVEPDPALPESARSAVNRAVRLAQAGLWKGAYTLLRRSGGDGHPATVWVAALIRLHASARARHAHTTAYPLLGQVFYGDYATAVDVMRTYDAEVLFQARSPLVVASRAVTWDANLVAWLERTTSAALEVEPDLAEAHFIRGWARQLDNPARAEALNDVRRATLLAPGDPLFEAGLTILTRTQRFYDFLLRDPLPSATP